MQRVHGVSRFNNGQIYINSRAQCEKLGAYRLRSCCEGGGWLLEFSLEKNRVEARKFLQLAYDSSEMADGFFIR